MRAENEAVGETHESVAVAVTPAGVPLRVVWAGREWHVGARPVRWYERRAWWLDAPRAAKGAGAGLIDVEIWLVQLRLNQRSELRSMELVHHQETGRWTIRPASS